MQQSTATQHLLPFERLSPADFERLCLWLLRREGFEKVEPVGVSGDEEGRDLTARREGRRVACQCKRVPRLGPKQGKEEIAKLLGKAPPRKKAPVFETPPGLRRGEGCPRPVLPGQGA